MMTETRSQQSASRLMPAGPEGRKRKSDPVLIRAVQTMGMAGALLGLLLYGWLTASGETLDRRQSLSVASEAGRAAAEGDLARIEAVAVSTAPFLVAALQEGAAPLQLRTLRAEISARLTATPVTAIIVFGHNGQAVAAFGQVPADAAGAITPQSTSRKAGSELLNLEFVRISDRRAAFYSQVLLADGTRQPVAFILRTGAFRAALDMGSVGGAGWRSAILNRDGDTVLAGHGEAGVFSGADAALAREALGWAPLYQDASPATGRITGHQDRTFVETRLVGGGMLQIAYLAEEASALAAFTSNRAQLIVLFGVTVLALLLAISLIQNEWQRHDHEQQDTDLILAQARASCDLLDAGVIEWSVADARVTYSQGWAGMFAEGASPESEEIFDWIARIHPDDRLAARDHYQDFLDGKVTQVEHCIRIRMSSSMWVPVIERGRAIHGADGHLASICLVQTPAPADGRTLREFLKSARSAFARAS